MSFLSLEPISFRRAYHSCPPLPQILGVLTMSLCVHCLIFLVYIISWVNSKLFLDWLYFKLGCWVVLSWGPLCFLINFHLTGKNKRKVLINWKMSKKNFLHYLVRFEEQIKVASCNFGKKITRIYIKLGNAYMNMPTLNFII